MQDFTPLSLPLEALLGVRVHSADRVEDVLQGGAQQRTYGRNQGLGWRHHSSENHNGHDVYIFREKCLNSLNRKKRKKTEERKKQPLGSWHHLGHGRHKVFACDGNGVDIKYEFL